MEFLANAVTGNVRHVVVNGTEYLVVPMSILVPGVLNGSKGSLFYPKSEVMQRQGVWNGVHILGYHPTKNGQPVSLIQNDGRLDQEVLKTSSLGIIKNDTWTGKKRIVEGWFEVNKVKEFDRKQAEAGRAQIYNRLKSGQPVELSTGLYTDNENAPPGATWNGRPYAFVARNYRPDHLAVLPDQVGACSLNDGCGVGVANAATANNDVDQQSSPAVESKPKKDPLEGDVKEYPAENYNPNHDEHGKFAEAADSAGTAANDKSKHVEATKATKAATAASKYAAIADTPGAHIEARQAHETAASVHMHANDSLRRVGRTQEAGLHLKAYAAHSQVARAHDARVSHLWDHPNLNYNPDQPRDENGRFAASEASGNAWHASKQAEYEHGSSWETKDRVAKAYALRRRVETGERGVTFKARPDIAGKSYSTKLLARAHEKAARAHRDEILSAKTPEGGAAHRKAAEAHDKAAVLHHALAGRLAMVGNEEILEINCGGIGGTMGPCPGKGTDKDVQHPNKITIGDKTLYHTGKTGTVASPKFGKVGEASAEYEQHDNEGNKTGFRAWRSASGKITTDNARRCPECGGPLDEEGECEECGYVENMNPNHDEKGRFAEGEGGGDSGDLSREGSGTEEHFRSFADDLDATITSGQGDHFTNWHKQEIDRAVEAVHPDHRADYWKKISPEIRENGWRKSERKYLKEALHKKPTTNSEVDMTKPQLIDYLVANCDCWKGPKDREVLNTFDEAKLTTMKNVVAQAKKNEVVANAARSGVKTKIGVVQYDDGRGVFILNAASLQGEQGGGAKMAGTEDSDLGNETTDSDMHGQGQGGTVGNPIAGGKAVKNASRLTKEEQEDLAYARNMKQQERGKLISRLVANVAEDKKQAAVAIYNKHSLDDLRQLVQALPPVRNTEHRGPLAGLLEPAPNYGGNGVFNTHTERVTNGDDGLLDEPRMTFNADRLKVGGDVEALKQLI